MSCVNVFWIEKSGHAISFMPHHFPNEFICNASKLLARERTGQDGFTLFSLKDGFFMASNTDIHGSTVEDYRITSGGLFRDMTLILAKDKSLPSLKEALKARRTLAYSFGTIAGDRQLLEDFFRASVKCMVVDTAANGTRTVMLINETSFPYYLNYGGDPMKLNPFGALSVSVKKDAALKVKVENMWHGSDEHLEVEYKL